MDPLILAQTLVVFRRIFFHFFLVQVSNSNELRVLNLIREACERALEEYPTTEEQDTAVMMDRGMYSLLSKNQRMAVKVKI